MQQNAKPIRERGSADVLVRHYAFTSTYTGGLLRCVSVVDGAIEAGLGIGGVRINQVTPSVEDLVGADRCPCAQVGAVVEADKGAFGTGGTQME